MEASLVGAALIHPAHFLLDVNAGRLLER